MNRCALGVVVSGILVGSSAAASGLTCAMSMICNADTGCMDLPEGPQLTIEEVADGLLLTDPTGRNYPMREIEVSRPFVTVGLYEGEDGGIITVAISGDGTFQAAGIDLSSGEHGFVANLLSGQCEEA